MLGIIKHLIYEKAIETVFDVMYKNFTIHTQVLKIGDMLEYIEVRYQQINKKAFRLGNIPLTSYTIYNARVCHIESNKIIIQSRDESISKYYRIETINHNDIVEYKIK